VGKIAEKAVTQWAKSPKKQSVGVYLVWHCILSAELTHFFRLFFFFGHFAQVGTNKYVPYLRHSFTLERLNRAYMCICVSYTNVFNRKKKIVDKDIQMDLLTKK